jgi:uncharacterized protein YjbJ (UPF0337 family)
MSLADKARNEAQELRGRTKEWVGDQSGNEEMRAEGKEDQLKARAKQAGEHVKDAGRDLSGR